MPSRFLFCSLLALASMSDAAASQPVPAPDFGLRTLDGQELSRMALADKVVVINFWATWCPDCHNALPGYIALQKQFGDEPDFVFIGISMDERPPEFVAKFAEMNGINYRLAMGDAALAKLFGGIDEIPTTFVIDRGGLIRFRQAGSISPEEFERVVRSLL